MALRLNSFDQIQAPIRLALFDLGGVVYSFSGGLEAIAQHTNIPLPHIREYWLSRDNEICRGELAPQEFWKDLVSHFGSGDAQLDFLPFWVSYFRPIPSVHAAMKAIQSRGVRLGIIANIYPGVFDVILENGVVPKLDYQPIVLSCDLGLVKPDPQIYQHAIGLTNLKPEEVVFVDDRAENTDAVEALGWYSLPFPPSRN